LSEGIVHDRQVTCPLHNWVISLEDGEAIGADKGATRRYPVMLQDGRVHIDTRPTPAP
jgi:nitrite reductase (NADH) small subunit